MTKNSGKADQQQLEGLHGVLAQVLAERIKSDGVTAADLAVARQFLKDNGIDGIPTASNPLGKLAESLPFQPEDKEDD